MKAFLRLKGKIRPRKKLSASSYQPSILNNQPSALRLWQFIKYCVLDKVRFLRIFLQSILVFVSCSAVLAQGSVVHTTPAGQAEVATQPILVGSRLPDSFWAKEHIVYQKGDTVSMSLQDFKGKFLILDFWATWCGYCRQNLPKLEKLQKEYPGHLNVMLVNAKHRRDDYNKVDKMYNSLLIDKGGASLPSILYDEYLIKLFPHTAIPNYVWIRPNGRVLAITHDIFVNKDQIEALLADENL